MARPQITDQNKKVIVQKLEPYLKAGLSMRKACFQTDVARSTVYYLMENDNSFLDQIRRFQQYLSVLISTSISKQLFSIIKKQNSNIKLSKLDLKFLFWLATNSNQTIEEFGRKQKFTSYDPELEISRISQIIDSESND